MPTAHDFSLTKANGAVWNLAECKGKTILVVNVASRCGYTPQYQGLEELHRANKDRGLVVIGVPCNQFGAQEPGDDAAIQEFCSKKYSVTFDVVAKVDVNGKSAAPLYAWLTDGGKAPIAWNFAKFLIGKDGAVVGRFDSKVAPDGKELRAAIEAAL